MPTRKVPWYPGASCHMTARGNHKSNIFRDEEDFQHYLILMEEALYYFRYEQYEIICYCLMDNHVHILIKTKDNPPGKFIGRVNGIYAKYFNKKYDYIGHLFQGRYHKEFIKNDAQMLEVSRYIHLNPVRANMVKKPERYKWSSYNMYIGKKQEKIIVPDRIFYYFNELNKRKQYRTFVENAITAGTPGVQNFPAASSAYKSNRNAGFMF
ncbi:transposase [Haloimpatiens sp. FM7330]|uniref:transposase n=1 Tax=Haloimpatiens sp. FM7330 TaxID=3298610 RepID=UPI003639B169